MLESLLFESFIINAFDYEFFSTEYQKNGRNLSENLSISAIPILNQIWEELLIAKEVINIKIYDSVA